MVTFSPSSARRTRRSNNASMMRVAREMLRTSPRKLLTGWSTSDVLGDAPASRRGRRAGHKCPYMLRRSVWPRRFAKTVFIQLLLVIVEPGAPRNGITRRCLPRSTWGSMPEPAWWRKWIGKLVLFLLLASSPWATIKIYQDQIRLGQPLSTFA